MPATIEPKITRTLPEMTINRVTDTFNAKVYALRAGMTMVIGNEQGAVLRLPWNRLRPAIDAHKSGQLGALDSIAHRIDEIAQENRTPMPRDSRYTLAQCVLDIATAMENSRQR